ncbi:type III-A CRISPR-associated protein Csm2 [Ligilactobacillus saerimneri]|uniref:CRISPR system Cms protein Csm2 n=1 Tax=Ligilactobacillus saerimneri 30a TaxID=1227363 RepID=M5J6B3_9LACO|nr:type III-A CRISPR-associated protein Csm2 [Ligilactobacillus saerimneri]EKW98567.1 CRISPR-associated protein, Csm2 family [Ligilactobacillus saerimneri 30a]MBU5309082.1 type III-A CRISPR-associated protein Csm2 [Ligilactobacillus saerimneri]
MAVTFKKQKYVNEAEQVIKTMAKKKFRVTKRYRSDELTTSQLRGLLALTSNIYDVVRNQGVKAAEERLMYFRIKLVYQGGRNAAIKELVDLSGLLDILEYIQSVIEDGDEKLEKELIIRFCRYMEALVAYFKYYGGKD